MKTSNRKWLIAGSLFAALLIVIIPHHALAQGSIPFTSPEVQDIYQKMVTFLVAVMEFMQRLLWPILLMIGGLIKSDIIYSAGMEEALLAIWSNIRNIVNILFVLILLYIAFYNVMGGKSQDYHVKAILPKFVIALIAVNFSFLLVKVAVDAVNVMTTAIFALPKAVERDLAVHEDFEKQFCEGIYGPANQSDQYKKNVEAASKDGNKAYCEPTAAVLSQDAKRFFSTYDSNNAAIALAINIAQIGKLDTVKETVGNLKGLFINSLFSLVLYLVYATAFIALLVILLVRLVVIWLAAALSPLYFLKYVLPESIAGQLGGDEMGKQFVQTLIAPIPIAIVMSIGFIMLTTVRSAYFGGTQASTLGLSTLGVSLLTSGLSTLQDVIAAVGTVVFIWVGVFKAASGTAADGIVQGIKGTVEGFGKWAALAPIKYAPIFPSVTVGDKEIPATSLATVGSVMQRMGQGFEQRSQEQAGQILEGLGLTGALAHVKDMRKANNGKDAMQSLVNARSQGALSDKDYQKEFADRLRKNPRMDSEFKWDIDFGEHKNKEGFKKALAEGTVKPEVFQRFVDHNQKTRYADIQPVTAKPAETKPGGKPGEQPAGGAGAAGAAAVGAGAALASATPLITDSKYSGNQYALTDREKAKVEAIRNAKDATAAEAAAGDEEAKKAVGEIEALANEQVAFRGQLAGAIPKGQAEVDKVIGARRQQLRAQLEQKGFKDADKRADAILYNDISADQRTKGAGKEVADTVEGDAALKAGVTAPPAPMASAGAAGKPGAGAKPGAAAKPAAKPPAAEPPPEQITADQARAMLPGQDLGELKPGNEITIKNKKYVIQ